MMYDVTYHHDEAEQFKMRTDEFKTIGGTAKG
jgi:hypothetical protein